MKHLSLVSLRFLPLFLLAAILISRRIRSSRLVSTLLCAGARWTIGPSVGYFIRESYTSLKNTIFGNVIDLGVHHLCDRFATRPCVPLPRVLLVSSILRRSMLQSVLLATFPMKLWYILVFLWWFPKGNVTFLLSSIYRLSLQLIRVLRLVEKCTFFIYLFTCFFFLFHCCNDDLMKNTDKLPGSHIEQHVSNGPCRRSHDAKCLLCCFIGSRNKHNVNRGFLWQGPWKLSSWNFVETVSTRACQKMWFETREIYRSSLLLARWRSIFLMAGYTLRTLRI